MTRVPQHGVDRLRGALAAARPPGPAAPGSSPSSAPLPFPSPPGDEDADGGAPLEDAGQDDRAREGMELVRRAQQGDADAFGELYDRYLDTVYRYVSYRVGDRALAEDLTSETFLKALRGIGSFSWQGRDVGAWLVTIARNLIADHYRSSRYRLELVTDDVLTPAGAATGAGPEDAVLAGLQADEVLDAVRRLRPEQQECVTLRFLQGLSVAETATVMGKNDAAVKALTHRAVRSLGRLLGEARP